MLKQIIIVTLLALPALNSFAQDNRHAIKLKELSKEWKYAEMWSYVKEAFPPGNSTGFNPMKLKNICLTIDSRTKDPNPIGNYIYLYQRKIVDAAGVDINKDSPEVISEKINRMWTLFEPLLVCDNLQFDVSSGSIIKYAVSTLFDEFVYDLVAWKVPLNKIDHSDNKTALDYVKAQIERNKGNAIEQKLKNYYKLLRDAGAKHKSEL